MAANGPETILLDLFPNEPGSRAPACDGPRRSRAPGGGLPLLRPDRRGGPMDAERARRADGDAALDGPVPGSPTREPRRRRARTNPDDRRSLLVGLAPAGTRLLKRARPRFRVYAEAV